MAVPVHCSRGHRWEVEHDPSRPWAGLFVCPVCGDAVFVPNLREGSAKATHPPPPAAANTLEPQGGPRPTPVPEAVRVSHSVEPTPRADVADTLLPSAGPRENPPALTTCPERIGDYEILGELGRGGMGVVYQAVQIRLKRRVALKMILGAATAGPDELARFQAEAEAAARLQHPNVVQIYEIGEHEGRPFLAMEYVDGCSLADRLRESPLPAREAALLVGILARAIDDAHQHGIIHRDLKPANVLLAGSREKDNASPRLPTPDSRLPIPKITDFGLAKKLDEDSSNTRTGTILGTPSYMAPEQAAGRVHEVGPATDVYALGAILYETLSGRPPFKGVSALDTMGQVMHDEPLAPSRLQPRVPRDLETVCLKCLQKDPRKRYASAAALAEDLGLFLAGSPIRARPVGRPERVWRWCRRNPVPASLLLAVTLGGAFGLWYLPHLSESLVHYSAMQGAAQQAEMFREINSFYSDTIVGRAKEAGTEVTHLHAGRPKAIPVPATFTIELGQHISNRSESGMQIRLYSDAPFRTRTDGGPRDDFEQAALDHLKADAGTPYARFEELQGKPVLRYATAQLMQQSCVGCHNSHPDSPKRDWQVGQVRGVLEIIRPLEKDMAQTREGVVASFWLLGSICGGLFTLSGLILALGRGRGRRPA